MSARHRRHPHSPWQAFADVQTLLTSFAFMCVAVFLIVVAAKTTSKSEGDMHPKAEYLATLTWDDKRDVDLDLWMKTPNGAVIFYGNRETTNIALDRDARGFITNCEVVAAGQTVCSGNQEIISIRAVIPGNYLLAVGYFAGHNEKTRLSYGRSDPEATIDADVRVQKVNPMMATMAEKKIHLEHLHDTMNVLAFHIDDNGNITTIDLPSANLILSKGGGNYPQ